MHFRKATKPLRPACRIAVVYYSRRVVQSITPQQAQVLIAGGQLDVVDVREPREWSNGHLPGSRLVPLAQLKASPKDLLQRDGVIFVCAAGVRSQAAAKLATENGFTHVYNLTGGTQSWVRAGLPLARD
jgi:adenylyltransferase/sulfurtransferase